MLIREFALVVLLFPPTLLGNDYRWYHAVEFWSSVVCSMENSKTVHFHGVLNNNNNSILFEQYFEAFARSIAHKCSITIILKTYTFPDSENTSFVDNNDVICEIAKEPSMWKITSNDELPFLVTSAKVERIRSDKAFGKNTWNVHVILVKNIRSFDKISKDVSSFKWKPYDRFIILIVCREEMLYMSRLDDILKTLWFKYKMQSILVAEAIAVAGDTRIDQAVRTYNPFAKINDSAYGRVEIINIKTAEEVSSLLSHLSYYRTNNMNGYELKTGIFLEDKLSEEEKRGLSTRYNNNHAFKDIDNIVLNTIAQHMNFTYRRMRPTDNKSFGYQLFNRTYVGALAYTGDIVYGRTDICFESFFIKKYSLDVEEDINFSVYMDFDKVCVFVPKATKIPKGLRLYHFFPLSVWICTMLSQIFVYLTWCFLQIFTPGRTEKISFCATICRLLLLNIGCSQKLPNTNAERILLSSILLTNITIVSLFSGILYNSFAHNMYYPDIENLRDFDASGLTISLATFGLADLFDDDNSSTLMRNLRGKLRYGEQSTEDAAFYRNGSGLSKECYFPILDAQYIDEDGGPLLHNIKECPGAFFLTYFLPKNSILQDGINIWIGRLNQAGLTMLWKKQTIQTLVLQEKAQQKKRIEKKTTIDFVPFNLSDVQSSFYMLLIGLSVSTIVFLHEKGWLRSRSRTEKSNSESTI